MEEILMELTAWHHTTGIRAKRMAETKDLPREEWLALRKKGIGGSDISAIAGLNPWRSAIDVFLDKTNRVPSTPDNPKMMWGRILEDPVARQYAQETGKKIAKVNAMLQHPEHDFALVNLDRIARNGTTGALEVKTTGWANDWAENNIPDHYYCQVIWEMGVSGLPWAQFATLIAGQDLVIPDVINFPEESWNTLLSMAERFWHDNVLKDVPPPPDENPATKDAYKLLYPEVLEQTVKIGPELEKLIKERQKLADVEKRAKSNRATIDSQILATMKTAKWAVGQDYKVTRVLKTSQKFNSKKFKEAHPDLFAAFSSSSETIYPLVRAIKK
ncbi:MAG: hypothetical protein GF350_11895 [Chitinivibrionales bacterium]|nr:hypothetical protein [Chitinivibrionales bacterium]